MTESLLTHVILFSFDRLRKGVRPPAENTPFPAWAWVFRHGSGVFSESLAHESGLEWPRWHFAVPTVPIFRRSWHTEWPCSYPGGRLACEPFGPAGPLVPKNTPFSAWVWVFGMAMEIFPKAWHTKMAWSAPGGTLPCRLSPFSGEVGTRNSPAAISVADWRANLSEPRGHSCRKTPHFRHGSGFFGMAREFFPKVVQS